MSANSSTWYQFFQRMRNTGLTSKTESLGLMHICGKFRHVLDAQKLSTNLKLRLYKAAVCSSMLNDDIWMRDVDTDTQGN